jgi:hypothetical protein
MRTSSMTGGRQDRFHTAVTGREQHVDLSRSRTQPPAMRPRTLEGWRASRTWQDRAANWDGRRNSVKLPTTERGPGPLLAGKGQAQAQASPKKKKREIVHSWLRLLAWLRLRCRLRHRRHQANGRAAVPGPSSVKPAPPPRPRAEALAHYAAAG